MNIPFIKMHSQGNDFVVLDNRQKKYSITKKKIHELSHRNKGIGFDQFIQLENSNSADIFMRIFNADGQEAEMCGNAARCVASLLFASKPTSEILIETVSLTIASNSEKNGDVSIDIEVPEQDLTTVSLSAILKTDAYNQKLLLENGVIINMGNPHIVFFCKDIKSFQLKEIGPLIEKNPMFKNGTNVEVVEIKNPSNIIVKVWERGAGLTLSCGSGALASFYAAYKSKLCNEKVNVSLPGGSTKVFIPEKNKLRMTGSVTVSFLGEFNI